MPKSNEFYRLRNTLAQTYLGKPVPKKYRKRYGKKYDLTDINEFTFALAKAKGIEVD